MAARSGRLDDAGLHQRGAAGGKFRYEWTNGKGDGFHITGEYLELEPYSRIVHVERMHLPDPTPDNHIETV